MARFLSPEWLAAFDRAAALIDIPAPVADAGLATRDATFAVCVFARDRSGAISVPVTLRVGEGRISVTAGTAADAAVTIRVTGDDAVAFMAGGWVPTPALTSGRVQIRGDLAVLRATGLVLKAVRPHLGTLLEDTEY